MKKVVILGGSSGIGLATAQRFAAEGWQVLIGAPDGAQVQQAVGQLPGGGHLACAVDVSAADDVQAMQNLLAEQWGRFDVLVNSVGISQGGTTLDSDFAGWERMFQVSLYGAVQVCRSLVPLLTDGGRIIHVTSIHQNRVAAGSAAYGMSKAALTQFTRSLAVELAPRNILANAVAPGFINTPLSVKADGRNELETEWFRENYIKNEHLPLKRAGQPHEVAGVIWFLAGPDASYMTGSVLLVDGGLTITF